MPNTSTAMPAHRSPVALPSRTWLPALVPSCQRKGQAPARDFAEEATLQGIRKRPRHILTFDLKEHFHASRLDSNMRRRHWASFQSRIQTNVDRILKQMIT